MAIPKTFTSRFPVDDVHDLASRYSYQDDKVVSIGNDARKKRYLDKDDLSAICRWESSRNKHFEVLTRDEVVEVSKIAFSCKSERLRAGSLVALPGVSWPTASAILQLCHRDRYPILDFRALWSLSVQVPSVYNFDFWWAYVEATRALADEWDVDMRTLDRALWQYSKENQPPLRDSLQNTKQKR